MKKKTTTKMTTMDTAVIFLSLKLQHKCVLFFVFFLLSPIPVKQHQGRIFSRLFVSSSDLSLTDGMACPQEVFGRLKKNLCRLGEPAPKAHCSCQLITVIHNTDSMLR